MLWKRDVNRLETENTTSQYCIALLTGVPFLCRKLASRFLIYLSLEVSRENYMRWKFAEFFCIINTFLQVF